MNEELLKELRENFSKVSKEDLAREIRELDASFASSGCPFDSNVGASLPRISFFGSLLAENNYCEDSFSKSIPKAA